MPGSMQRDTDISYGTWTRNTSIHRTVYLVYNTVELVVSSPSGLPYVQMLAMSVSS